MKILAELRSLKKQIIELQKNQKEKEVLTGCTIVSSGMAYTPPDPIQQIGMLEMEIEALYNKLIDAQTKVIQYHENNY